MCPSRLRTKMNSPRTVRDSTTPPSVERRPAVYIAALLVLSIVATLACFILADFYLHYRQGINLSGYRGPSVGKKRPGEVRIAVVGGSTTWGYGLPWYQSFPAQLEGLLRQSSAHEVRVLNLGFNSEGAYSFGFTLRDYESLDYDIVVIYSGYNDQAPEPNRAVFRGDSPTFALTGYMPLLPSFVREKFERLTHHTSKSPRKTVFVPPSTSNIGGKTNEEVATALRAQMAALEKLPSRVLDPTPGADCSQRWAFYCEQIKNTIEFSLARGKRVVVVTEPYIGAIYIDQQREMAAMLAKRWSNRTEVRYVNLGSAIDLGDPTLCWDGMHLTEEGNRRIAQALALEIKL